MTYIKFLGLPIEHLGVSGKVPQRTVFLKHRFEGLKMAKKSKIGQKRIAMNRNKSRDAYQLNWNENFNTIQSLTNNF